MTAPAHELAIAIRASPLALSAVITINGLDLLDWRAARRADGRSGLMAVRAGRLLPPDSPCLLPTVTPQQAMVGVCESDGEAGCNSLWVQVRRAGGRVLWEPDPRSPRRTIACTWSFDVLPYLDAVDRATSQMLTQESRADALARELRRRRDSLFGFPMNSSTEIFRLLGAQAGWVDGDAGHRQLIVTVAGESGQFGYVVPTPEESTDDEILLPLHHFRPEDHAQWYGQPWIRPVPLPWRTG